MPKDLLFFPQSETTFNGVDTQNDRLISLRFHFGSNRTVRGVVLHLPTGQVTLRKR
jgi:hypothetical protein